MNPRTEQTTGWTSKEENHQTFLEALDHLDEIFTKSGNAINTKLAAVNKNTYHFIVDILKPRNRVERALCFHILNIAYQAEILSQGSGVAAFAFCIGFMKHLLRGDKETFSRMSDEALVEPYQLEAARVKTLTEKLSQGCTAELLREEMYESVGRDKVLTEVLWSALETAGLEGKIFLESGPQGNFIVEQKTGYAFKSNPFKFFLSPKHLTWETSRCKVLIVDGLVENVSELDVILTKTFETKIPLVLVAQGFSEEVVATLKANQEKKNFQCIPVRIMPDVSSLNVINDIAVVCGSLPVSTLKGDLISYVRYDELPVVDRVRCNLDTMVIENNSTRAEVGTQIKMLLEKRQQQTVDDLVDFIDARLKSLVSNSVIIHLPNVSSMEIDSLKIKLDNALRRSKSVLNYGLVKPAVLEEEFSRSFSLKEKTVLTDAVSSGLKYIASTCSTLPSLSLLGAVTIAGKPMILLHQSNGMVYFR